MKVRLLVSRVTNDGAQNRGDEIDVPENELEGLIAAGQVELLRKARVERAVGPQTGVERA